MTGAPVGPRMSVVVPTRNRPELLARCLAALLRQDFAPDDYEIIVVDDGPDPTTRHVVETAREAARPMPAAPAEAHARGVLVAADGAAPGLTQAGKQQLVPADQSVQHSLSAVSRPPAAIVYLSHTGAHGPAAARNMGWRAAAGEIVAFTDDDCVPAPGWLRAGLEAMTGSAPDPGDLASAKIVGASGQVVVPLPFCPTDYELNAAGLQRSEFVTANCFYRREALVAVGGFDERFTAAWREDSDLFFTLLARYGDRLTCAPRAVVFHPVRPAPWGVSLSQQRKSMFNALLYKKHPRFYRTRLGDKTPWRYYAILLALGTVLAGTLASAGIVASVGAGAWVLLTGHFWLMRLRGVSHTFSHVAEMAVTSVLIPPLSVFWRVVGAVKYGVFFS
jgi:glycosyltransferase involved in cell wall biosynthesis